MYVKNNIPFNIIETSNDPFDVIIIQTFTKPSLLLILLYRSPTLNLSRFSDGLANILTQFNVRGHSSISDYTVIMGDFNFDLFKHQGLQPLANYRQLIEQSTTSGSTLLDHIYISPTPANYSAGILNTYYSYHEPVFLSLDITL